MTLWHLVLIGGCVVAIVAFAAIFLTADRHDESPDDTTHAPEAEADTRFVTKIRRGNYHTHIF